MIKQIFTVIILILTAETIFAAEPNNISLLRDGFVLSGVDGSLVARGTKWHFELEQPVSDGTNTLAGGIRLQMLPSSGLEKMISDIKQRPKASYRLYNAVVTKYKGANYIFSDYFLPLTDEPKIDSGKSGNTEEPVKELAINEPNDAVIIPKEILDKLQSRRIIRPDKTSGRFEITQDSVLADRLGVIVIKEDGSREFVFDSAGRNMPRISLELLPSQILEITELKQASDPGRKRYRVSGIVTKYNNKYYLLLQRATRSYSYGNFGT